MESRHHQTSADRPPQAPLNSPGENSIGTFGDYSVGTHTWHWFAAIQIWIFVLFLLYAFICELNERLGTAELTRMLLHVGRDRTHPGQGIQVPSHATALRQQTAEESS